MKNKTVSTFLLASCTTIIMGACVAEQIPLESNQGSIQGPEVESLKNPDDATLIAAQTDLYALLAKQVQYKDSVYSLALTREDARILNIPDSIYDKFEHAIILMNEKREK